MTPPEKCGCGQKLLWARTERGRWIPLNPKPDPAGNQAAWQDSDGTWKTRQIGENSDPPWGFETIFMPHAATCPGRTPTATAGTPGPAPDLAQLKREMAEAHPDWGGTAEQFIAARTRYERARDRGST